ncbi:MAG: NAD(P)H-dependent oxidoreductase subunit E [Nitrospirae bacterium]|nr:NAD(P)H-dependent oxidoreductase subunit E [Nitrospirota bacterium]
MLEISTDNELKLNDILNRYTAEEGNIISLLQDTQDVFGYIPEKSVGWFSKKLDIPESRFYGVITFYAQFHMHPRGRNLITACCGTACHVRGSDRLINSIQTELKLPEGKETTEDGEYTLEKVACVGACSIAPVVIINKKVFGEMTINRLMKELKGKKVEE